MTLQEFSNLNSSVLNTLSTSKATCEQEAAGVKIIEMGFLQLSESDKTLIRNFCDARLADIIF